MWSQSGRGIVEEDQFGPNFEGSVSSSSVESTETEIYNKNILMRFHFKQNHNERINTIDLHTHDLIIIKNKSKIN